MSNSDGGSSPDNPDQPNQPPQGPPPQGPPSYPPQGPPPQQGDYQQGRYQQGGYQQQPPGGWAPPPGTWQPMGIPQGPKIGPGVRLGPMTFADVLDGAFQLIKANWKSIGVSVLIYSVPMAVMLVLITIVFATDVDDIGGQPGLFTTVGAGIGVAALLATYVVQVVYTLLAYPLLAGTITRIGTASYLGRPISAKVAFSGVLKLWMPLVGASVITGIGIFFGLIFCILPGVALWTLFTAVVPIIAIEESKVFPAISRSWNLMWSRFWMYLAILFVAAVIGTFIGTILQIPFGIISGIFDALGVTLLAGVFYGLATVVSTLVVTPFTAMVSLLVYFDARVRNEGFDVQVLAAGLGDQHPQQP